MLGRALLDRGIYSASGSGLLCEILQNQIEVCKLYAEVLMGKTVASKQLKFRSPALKQALDRWHKEDAPIKVLYPPLIQE